jgi:hypothetical protein
MSQSRLYTRAHKTMPFLEFYAMRQWYFVSRNPVQLTDNMSNREQSTLNFYVRKIDWETNIDTYVAGVRK